MLARAAVDAGADGLVLRLGGGAAALDDAGFARLMAGLFRPA